MTASEATADTESTIVYVVSLVRRYSGPIFVGFEDRLPAKPALLADLRRCDGPYDNVLPPDTYRWGCCLVRIATEHEKARLVQRHGEEAPWILSDGRPTPRAPRYRSDNEAS